jgi:hypothetical protein
MKDSYQSLLTMHLGHGIELHHYRKPPPAAQFRCSECCMAICDANERDIAKWVAEGAELQPAYLTKAHLTLIWSQ